MRTKNDTLVPPYSKRLDVVFYQSELGKEPVREWLQQLPKPDKKRIGEDIKTVQFAWPIGKPLVDSLASGLWEIRICLVTNKIARIVFFIDESTMLLVNSFVKKSQKTPRSEIDLSLKRKRFYLEEKLALQVMYVE